MLTFRVKASIIVSVISQCRTGLKSDRVSTVYEPIHNYNANNYRQINGEPFMLLLEIRSRGQSRKSVLAPIPVHKVSSRAN